MTRNEDNSLSQKNKPNVELFLVRVFTVRASHHHGVVLLFRQILLCLSLQSYLTTRLRNLHLNWAKYYYGSGDGQRKSYSKFK